MTEFHKALYEFWSSFGLPVYMSGRVPDKAQMPYITIDVEKGNAFATNVLTAFNWHKAAAGSSANAERAAVLDEIADRITTDGIKIDMQHGFFIIGRNTGFQSYWDDPENPDVIAGRTSYTVRFYTM